MKQSGTSAQSTRRKEWIGYLIPSVYREMSPGEMNSLYLEYLRDTKDLCISSEVVDLIEKDINRTKISAVEGLERDYLNGKVDGESIRSVLIRILTVFASTNKSIGYVQGMNVICSIIYYVISVEEWLFSESTAYFCFFYLMVDIGDYFTEKMDNTETGIFGEQVSILKLLKKTDKSLFKAVKKRDLLGKSAFHIRWMVLLFSAEFLLKDTLAVWDRFFKESPKRKLVPYFCASVLIILREKIINEEEMKLLSSLEIVRINPREALDITEKLARKVPYSVLKRK